MDIKDSIFYYEKRAYIVKVYASFLSVKYSVTDFKLIDTFAVENSLEFIVNHKNSFLSNSDYDFDYLNQCYLEIYLSDFKQVKKREAVKFKSIKSKVASKYKIVTLNVPNHRFIYKVDVK